MVELFEGQKKLDESFIDFVDGVIPNKLLISEYEVLENLKNIQKKNKIPISEKLDGMNFSVEMETGTGKTYVYLRTIYELNKNYGFKKFIIIVPSIAIREGTKKNYEILRDDLAILYHNIPIECKVYQSKNLSYVRQFTHSNKLEIMIITLDSFNRDDNILNTPQPERGFYGKKPIELIQKINPIVILDEPQNMESGKSKVAIAKLNPLFTLRYSATHREPYNLVYRLSPVEAYQRGLVKKILVQSVIEDENPNSPHVELLDIKIGTKIGTKIQAKIKIIKKLNNRYAESSIWVKVGDDLYQKTKNKRYENYIVKKIDKQFKFIEFSKVGRYYVGQKMESSNKNIQREQIRNTILNHFDTQQDLKKKGIKVLSLFFIDRVANYKNNGILKQIFDEEFNSLKEKFDDFKDLSAEEVQDGYFSNFKTDNIEKIEKDKESFDRIMKNKEKLLSFDDRVCFIFSHSALREGWDNPNVFNICTLNQSVSEPRKRQEIGRGLRLPVDQSLKQILDEQYFLRVIANESYTEYVKSLQTQYEEDYGYANAAPKIINEKNKVLMKINNERKSSKEFKDLWDKISMKTRYVASINSEKIVEECIKTINEVLRVDSLRIKVDTISIDLEQKDDAIQLSWKTVGQSERDVERNYTIINIVDELNEQTNLTRKTIVRILLGINNLDLIFKNPANFTMSVSEIIKNILHKHMIENIQYTSINEKYGIFSFKEEYVSTDDTVKTEKSVFDKIEYDSEFEKVIANYLNDDERVKFYLKMPRWFTISTPIGNYITDWAIVSEKINAQGKLEKTLYFVVESKAKKDQDLGTNEKLKIKCGQSHFKTLDVPFLVVKSINELQEIPRSL